MKNVNSAVINTTMFAKLCSYVRNVSRVKDLYVSSMFFADVMVIIIIL